MGELGGCKVCGKDAVVVYPLLHNAPRFCYEHHNPRDAGPFGCDFTGPDDFDIPTPGEPLFAEHDSVWIDDEGRPYREDEIGDDYLVNIVRFLQRRIQEAQRRGEGVRALALEAKKVEMEEYVKQRGLEV